MNIKKRIAFVILLIFSIFNIYAKNTISLVDKAKKEGMTVYWDSLSETGILEKNGHQLTFRKDQQVVVLDSMRLMVTDAPTLEDNKLYVSQKFIDDTEDFFNQTSAVPFKVGAIVIDPGHGGKDNGASRDWVIDGKKVTIREKDINLKIGKMLYETLKTAYPDKQIVLTRDTDVFLTLGERTDISNGIKVKENEAVLFISIHVNSSLNKNASGYEVWYLSPGYRRTVIDDEEIKNDPSLFPILNSMMEEEFTTESIMIAKFIMDGLEAQIGNLSDARGIKEEEWFVVRNSNMPSVLVEVGFVSNEKEARLLNDDQYLKKVTLGIYNGIAAFITHFERSQGFTSVK